MRFRWPKDTAFVRLDLEIEDRSCPSCGRAMHICDHRHHPIFTLQGPTRVVCKLVHCPDTLCAGHTKTFSPYAEASITQPRWLIGWDVFCWLGHRRFARHWSVPQLRGELVDSYHIPLSHDAIEDYLRRYQTMLAARHQDPQMLADAYADVDGLILTIDGLQPEKGHETLYVVRELTRKRVWFAEPLISSSAAEVRRLLVQARLWAERLGKPIKLWLSDKQDAFVAGIAAEFPGVPHRYCSNHFLRDVAKPVLDADSHAKVQMRSKVRGLRAIEREVLQPSPPTQQEAPAEVAAVLGAKVQTVYVAAEPAPPMAAIVLDYCTAVRGILNDDQGGPLQPPGLRMAAALGEVRESLQRNLEAKKGGALRTNSNAWPAASTAASRPSKRSKRTSPSR
jgi:hypothetical protein